MTNLITVLITMAFTALLIIGCARQIDKDISVKKAGAVNASRLEPEGSGKRVLPPEKEKIASEDKGLAGVFRKGLKAGVYLFGWTP